MAVPPRPTPTPDKSDDFFFYPLACQLVPLENEDFFLGGGGGGFTQNLSAPLQKSKAPSAPPPPTGKILATPLC